MTSERIKEIQSETAYPESVSVMLALDKVWNECEQQKSAKNKGEVRYLKDTISLLNSMVVGGETHSDLSLARVRESMSILNNL